MSGYDWSLDCEIERDARRLDEEYPPRPGPPTDPEKLRQAEDACNRYAFEEGKRAAAEGLRMIDNPFWGGSAMAIHWNRGWWAA